MWRLRGGQFQLQNHQGELYPQCQEARCRMGGERAPDERWFLEHNSALCPGYLKIMEIPKGARHLLIQEVHGSPHVLGERRTRCPA